jgi:hypothetical protein
MDFTQRSCVTYLRKHFGRFQVIVRHQLVVKSPVIKKLQLGTAISALSYADLYRLDQPIVIWGIYRRYDSESRIGYCCDYGLSIALESLTRVQ